MSSKLQRLFVTSALAQGATVGLAKHQAHYLGNVLRLKPGDALLLFNGSDGEWCAELSAVGKKGAEARLTHQTRPQDQGPDLQYLFAPLKRARLDYMAQKATELGVSALRPVITRHTVAERVNTDRLLANAVEAAEQCGILRVPEVMAPEPLAKLHRRVGRKPAADFRRRGRPARIPHRGACESGPKPSSPCWSAPRAASSARSARRCLQSRSSSPFLSGPG